MIYTVVVKLAESTAPRVLEAALSTPAGLAVAVLCMAAVATILIVRLMKEVPA